MKFLPCFLTVLALAGTVASAAPGKWDPALPSDVPGSEAILLGIDSVQRDLKLNSLQRTLINSIRKEYREEARALVANAADTTASKKLTQSKLDALTASYDKRALGVLSSSQSQRLIEIEHQVLGGYMLLSPELQQELSLTAKQKEKLAVIWNKAQKYVSKINGKFENGEISHNEKIHDLYENRLDSGDDMLDVLTDAQRQKFDELAGVKFVG